MPLPTDRWSMDTVKAVSQPASVTMAPMARRSSRRPSQGMHTSPRP
jgi:hypothetical protein